MIEISRERGRDVFYTRNFLCYLMLFWYHHDGIMKLSDRNWYSLHERCQGSLEPVLAKCRFHEKLSKPVRKNFAFLLEIHLGSLAFESSVNFFSPFSKISQNNRRPYK